MLVKSGRKFLSIRTKIFILLVTSITIPFVISGILTYHKYTTDSEQSISNYANQIVSQISLNLDRYIKELERVTLAPQYDAAVMGILKEHSDPALKIEHLQLDEQLKMIFFMSSLEFERSEIRGIVLFTNDGVVFSNSEVSTKNLWFRQHNGWMDAVDKEAGGLTIIPPHEVQYYNAGETTVFSLARQIREPYTHRKLGIIKIDLNATGMERILSQFNLGINSELFVTDKWGQQLFPFSPTERSLSADNKWITTSIRSDYSELLITGQVPNTELRENAFKLIQFTLLISGMSLLVACFLAIMASERLIKPLLHLRRKMMLVQTGSFSVRADVTTHDEIGDVTETFNKMISEIQRLVKEVYEVKLRERESELFALQSQMNPHFLYNTLESISMLAIQKDQLLLSSTVTSLGRLLRYTIDHRQTKVSLTDELKFARAYFQIQVMRFGDKVQSTIRVDPEIEQLLIPKLLIQPFIENAIEHGMDQDLLSIQVRAEIMDGRLQLIIEDDGNGMDTDTIRELVKRMRAVEDEDRTTEVFGINRKGYALRNAYQRIRLLYGDAYGIQINNLLPKGVRFIITLPLEWRPES